MTPDDRNLNSALRTLAGHDAREAPPDIERVLLAAFRSRQRKRKMAMWWSGSAAAAVAAGVTFMLAIDRPAGPAAPPAPHNSGQAQARPTLPPQQVVAVQRKVYRAPKRRMPRQETAEFYALPDADANIPLEYATVVRVQLPMSDLREMGFPINEQHATERIETDVLLGQDGVARAIRFVQ